MLCNRKIFLENSLENRRHFDKTSPENRNPQQRKISRNATKKTAQLCGKTAQLATLLTSCPVPTLEVQLL